MLRRTNPGLCVTRPSGLGLTLSARGVVIIAGRIRLGPEAVNPMPHQMLVLRLPEKEAVNAGARVEADEGLGEGRKDYFS